MGEACAPCRVCGRETFRLPTPAGLEDYLAVFRICPSCGHEQIMFTVVHDFEPGETPWSIFDKLNLKYS